MDLAAILAGRAKSNRTTISVNTFKLKCKEVRLRWMNRRLSKLARKVKADRIRERLKDSHIAADDYTHLHPFQTLNRIKR